jgi:putative ABC transport system permease protein
MFQLVAKGLRYRARRFIGTVLAIVLGVAFLAGTLVLNDTLQANFTSLFGDANANTDVVVRSNTDVGELGEVGSNAALDRSLVDTIEGVDGVADAEPSITGYGQIVGTDGELIGGNGPPTLAGNWIERPGLNAYELAEGRAPEADDEVVVNRGAAKDGDIALGDRIVVQVPQPVEVTVVGIAMFAGTDGLGPTTFTGFTLDAAERYFGGPDGKVTTIQVAADTGVSQDELLSRVEQVLPSNAEAITGSALTNENVDDINADFLGFFKTFLLVFALIALAVGTFSIYNTFSIVVAQRTQESALLRALGAARRQVLASVLAETAVVGAVASAIGVGAGIGLAAGLKTLLRSAGFSALPSAGLTIRITPLVIAFLVGLVVAILAGTAPAVRAGRVSPMAALRDTAAEARAIGRGRFIGGIAVVAAGIGLVLLGAAGGGLALVGLGGLLSIVGTVVAGPLVARPASAAIGAPVAASRGVPGMLARQNAMRNPRRTAATASALMIGVGVVTLFTVMAASIKASITDVYAKSVRADLIVGGEAFGGSGYSPQLATDVAALPEVQDSVGIGLAGVVIHGDTSSLSIGDPATLQNVLDLEVSAGSLDDMDASAIAISKATAEDEDWTVGTSVPVTFADGTTQDYRVAAIYDAAEVVGNQLMTREGWAGHGVQDIDRIVLVNLRDGVSTGAGQQAIGAVMGQYGSPEVKTVDTFVDDSAAGINMALALIYVMLALAVLIAVMGIANTLSLAIHERTRELGLLRAVGQDRSGIRSMVRWESVIIALFGTVGGVLLGTFLSWAVMQGIAQDDTTPLTAFSLPVTSLVVILVVGAVAGVLAGIRPARKAAKLDVLQAIATA